MSVRSAAMDIEDDIVDYSIALQTNHIECLLHEIADLRSALNGFHKNKEMSWIDASRKRILRVVKCSRFRTSRTFKTW